MCHSNKNIFALVEIKFEGDRIQQEQFNNYEKLKEQCVKEKFESKAMVSEGFKLSLFRYPEDQSPKDDQQENKPSKSKGSVKK